MALHRVGASVAVAALLVTGLAWCQAPAGESVQAGGAVRRMRMPGLFGPVSAQLKVGDLAPEIALPKVLHAPGPAIWGPASMVNTTTVMVFYPDTSHNPERVSDWNALVKKLADKPVQFVWVTGEEEVTLLPFLKEHPVSGWVFHDSKGEIGRAYGLEMPVMVAVGRDQRIIGFDKSNIAREETVNAILEGRIRTEPVTRAELRAFMQSGKVLLDAKPWRIPEPDAYRPAFAPSKTLHVSVSKGEENGNYGGDDFWSRKGYTLKKLIAEIYDVEPIRVALPAALDDGKRYDFALVVSEHLGQEGMRSLARQGIEDYFHIALMREQRLVEVYVVTTAGGSPPSAKALPTGGGMGFFSSASFMPASGVGDEFAPPEHQPLSAMRSFSMSDGTMEDFCRNLEMNLDRPVVDETELKSRFEFAMKGDPDPRAINDKNDFPERLREQLHLAITSARRQVEVLAFYPQGN